MFFLSLAFTKLPCFTWQPSKHITLCQVDGRIPIRSRGGINYTTKPMDATTSLRIPLNFRLVHFLFIKILKPKRASTNKTDKSPSQKTRRGLTKTQTHQLFLNLLYYGGMRKINNQKVAGQKIVVDGFRFRPSRASRNPAIQEDQMGLNYRRPTPKPPFAWQPSQEYEPYLKKSRGEGFVCVCVRLLFL